MLYVHKLLYRKKFFFFFFLGGGPNIKPFRAQIVTPGVENMQMPWENFY
jgi:hypothetical protein